MLKKVTNKIELIITSTYDKLGENKLLKYLIIFFILLPLIPAFVPNIFRGHDTSFHLSRIQGIVDSIRSDSFPALVYPGYVCNYGHANGIFYPDLFLYIPAFLCLLGINIITSYKIFFIIITIAIWASMYFCTHKITKSKYTAIIISILYLVSTYRITDMWIRGSLGETLTFVFFPLLFLGLYQIIYGNEKVYYWISWYSKQSYN